MISPLKYTGAKVSLAPHLNELFNTNPHDVFVDAFGGSGAVIFNKPPSRVEVWNDLNAGIVTLFRILREGGERCAHLKFLLDHTPYSRIEWCEARDKLRNPDTCKDEVELASATFIAYNCSVSGKIGGTSAGFAAWDTRPFVSRLDNFDNFIHRLRNVIVESLPALDLIEKYRKTKRRTLFYLDPPYAPATRTPGIYIHEMTSRDHEQLVVLLASDPEGVYILSGYDHPVYHSLVTEFGWSVHDTPTMSTLRSDGVVVSRTERTWTSPAVKIQLRMF